MNLHSIRMAGAYFWMTTRSGNGHSMGTHLFLIERSNRPTSEPEPINDTNIWHRNWWTDPYIAWRPFSHGEMTIHPRGRWTSPLCGRQSAARTARANWAWSRGWDTCGNCTRVATERGIIPAYYSNFTEQDPEYLSLTAAEFEWQNQRDTRRRIAEREAQTLAETTLQAQLNQATQTLRFTTTTTT